MREILFRGVSTDSVEWVEGWFEMYPYGRWPLKETIIPAKEAKEGHFYHVEVIPETVGQFTGLTDKNGKKIFEGDIIQLHGRDLPHWYKEGQKVVVKYDGGGYVPMCEYDSDCGDYVEPMKCEVIGNIHDNPELLEG